MMTIPSTPGATPPPLGQTSLAVMSNTCNLQSSITRANDIIITSSISIYSTYIVKNHFGISFCCCSWDRGRLIAVKKHFGLSMINLGNSYIDDLLLDIL